MINDFSHTVSETALMSKAMNSSLFTTLVKVDHIIFKHHAYSAIFNNDAQKASTFKDQHNCRMGKWYYEGEGKQLFSNTKAYKKMEAPHAKVHQSVFSVIGCTANGDCISGKNFHQLVKAMAEMETSSKELFIILDDMVKEDNPDIGI